MTDDAALAAAHAARDAARVVTIYEAAAAGRGIDAAAFLLTQAWVYALEAGDRRATALQERLRALGAE
jgi:hypothetical protein